MASLVPGLPPSSLSRSACKGKKERGTPNVLDQLQTALCSVLGMQEPQLATLMRVRDQWSSVAGSPRCSAQDNFVLYYFPWCS